MADTRARLSLAPPCGSRQELIQASYYCHKEESRENRCSFLDPTETPLTFQSSGANTEGSFSRNSSLWPRPWAARIHRFQRACHDGPCGECSLSLTLISTFHLASRPRRSLVVKESAVSMHWRAVWGPATSCLHAASICARRHVMKAAVCSARLLLSRVVNVVITDRRSHATGRLHCQLQREVRSPQTWSQDELWSPQLCWKLLPSAQGWPWSRTLGISTAGGDRADPEPPGALCGLPAGLQPSQDARRRLGSLLGSVRWLVTRHVPSSTRGDCWPRHFSPSAVQKAWLHRGTNLLLEQAKWDLYFLAGVDGRLQALLLVPVHGSIGKEGKDSIWLHLFGTMPSSKREAIHLLAETVGPSAVS